MNEPALSKSKRGINFIIDNISITVLSVVVYLFFLKIHISSNESIIVLSVYLMYYILLEGFTGRTLGKYFTNSEVIFIKKRNRWFWTVIRTFLRLNPFDLVSYLFGTNYGTHDLLSFTWVAETVE
jgi:hypothetical protein